jgi:hypothetical protein
MKYLISDILWLGPPAESPYILLPPVEHSEERFYDEMFDAVALFGKEHPFKEDPYYKILELVFRGSSVMIGTRLFEVEQ